VKKKKKTIKIVRVSTCVAGASARRAAEVRFGQRKNVTEFRYSQSNSGIRSSLSSSSRFGRLGFSVGVINRIKLSVGGNFP